MAAVLDKPVIVKCYRSAQGTPCELQHPRPTITIMLVDPLGRGICQQQTLLICYYGS